MNETTEQTPLEPEPLNNEIAENDETIFAPQSTLPFPETVDLNKVFPEEETDLNDLFLDEETKMLLKKIQRNKKDLHTMTDRFNEESWAGDTLTDDEEDSKPSDEGGKELQEKAENP